MTRESGDKQDSHQFELANEPDETPHYSIDRYQVEKTLGTGGMSTVMLAYDKERQQHVALKVPRAQPAEKVEQFEKRFLREAKAALAVRHPNLCRLYHVGVDSGTFFLTMAYIQGMTLNELLDATGPLAEEDAAMIIKGVASGLAELHDQGILHRDLKPDNIMIDRDGTPIVLDFGLAKFFTGEGAWDDLTASSQFVGTPAHIAPEQVRGKKVSPRTDQFSLGTVLWTLLCDREPFHGNPLKVLDKILKGEYVSPRHHRPGLSPEMEYICMTMMSFDPRARFESMEDVIAELQAFLEQRTQSD